MKKSAVGPPLRVEELEPRLVLSPTPGSIPGLEHGYGLRPIHSAQRSGNQAGPVVKLDLVALHEFGHALGLEHHPSSTSIMFDGYNSNYNKANLANDPAVVANPNDGYASLLEIYTSATIAGKTTPWKDSLDPLPGNGRVDLTMSFVPDGSTLAQGNRSTLFATFDTLYGRGNWQSIFGGELNRWAAASGGRLAFVPVSDNGSAFDSSGAAKNDPRFGDIRIGARPFDGQGLTLANAYFPPPNGVTAPGDTHFDESENWDGRRGRGPGSISDSGALQGGGHRAGAPGGTLVAVQQTKASPGPWHVAGFELDALQGTQSPARGATPAQARAADLLFTSDSWSLGF